MVGLLKALNGFDAEKGRSSLGYAAPTILGELRRHYRDTGWAVHVPRSKQELAQRTMRAERAIRAEGSRRPPHWSPNVSTSGVEGVLASQAMRTSSIDHPVQSDEPEAATVADRIGRLNDGYEQIEHRLTVSALTRDLPERERSMLALRYGAEMPQREIGERIGVSKMQVSRLMRQTIDHIGSREMFTTAEDHGLRLKDEKQYEGQRQKA